MNKDLEFLTRVIDEKSAKILDANDKIWEYAELAFHETKSGAVDSVCSRLFNLSNT